MGVDFFKMLDAFSEVSVRCEREISECEKALEATGSRVLDGWISGARFVLDEFERKKQELCREGF